MSIGVGGNSSNSAIYIVGGARRLVFPSAHIAPYRLTHLTRIGPFSDSNNTPVAMDTLETAQDEWDQVAEIVPTFQSAEGAMPAGGGRPVLARETPLLSEERAIQHFRDTVHDKPAVDFIVNRRLKPMELFTCGICRRTSLKYELRADLSLAVALTQTPFDDQDPKHFQILLTLFKQLTGNQVDCARYGSHWEQIGFQGNDPATDLRGVGCLGLLQPLAVLTNSETFPMAQSLYRLSLNETQEFPFMVLSINLTRMAYVALKDGMLNRICNERSNLWEGLNLFYAAIMLHYYNIWKTQHKTIQDSGYVLLDTESYCRKHVDLVIGRLQKHLDTVYSAEEKNRARQNIKNRSVIKY